MKFNFTVDIDNTEYLQEAIIGEASERLIEKVLGDIWDEDNLYNKLEKKVLNQISSTMNMDFKKEVAEKVTKNLTDKFEKTKQYKSLLNQEEILSDNLIKTGLRDLVADIVRSEMKKMFK